VSGQRGSQAQSGEAGGRAETALIWLRIATELAGLAYMIYVMWVMLIPEHQRRLMLMQATAMVQRAAAAAACRAGRQAMGLELSGYAKNYELPYRLSLLRDAAAAVYERLRYTA
jgi:hypothetical protein